MTGLGNCYPTKSGKFELKFVKLTRINHNIEKIMRLLFYAQAVVCLGWAQCLRDFGLKCFHRLNKLGYT